MSNKPTAGDLLQKGGWVVTTIEKNGYKIAHTEEDDPISDLENLEWHFIEEEAVSKPTELKHELGRFFIADLLKADKREKGFECHNIKFIKVYLTGTIISRFPSNNDKIRLVVDDGTSNIVCFVEKNQQVDDLKEKISEKKEDYKFALLQNKNDSSSRLLYVMAKNALQDLNVVPSGEDLKKGDVISFVGTMKEYLDQRYVFISKIRKERNPEYNVKYLEDMTRIYKQTYNAE